jgi:hypothetical protein
MHLGGKYGPNVAGATQGHVPGSQDASAGARIAGLDSSHCIRRACLGSVRRADSLRHSGTGVTETRSRCSGVIGPKGQAPRAHCESRSRSSLRRSSAARQRCGLLIPSILGWAISGIWVGFWTGLIWGGLVRVFLVHHVTWSVNSAGHLWGLRPYKSGDESRNNYLLGILAVGAWFPLVATRYQLLHDPAIKLHRTGVKRQDSLIASSGEGAAEMLANAPNCHHSLR